MDAAFDPTRAALDSARRDLRVCEECGTIFLPKRLDQKFDSPLCTKKWWSRTVGRAGEIYPVMMVWRRSRGKKKFTEFTNMLDRWIAEDKEREIAILEAKHSLKQARS